MALASASQRVGGGAKIAEKWRISAVFDPIPEGTRTTGHGPQNTGFCSRRKVAGPVAGNHGQRSKCDDSRGNYRTRGPVPTGHG